MTVTALMLRLWSDESGGTAIEYALIAGIMSVALIGVMALGGALDGVYDNVTQIIDAIGEDGGGEGEGEGG